MCRNWTTEYFRLSISHDASFGDFLLAHAYPIEKLTLWEDFHLRLLRKRKVLPKSGIGPGTWGTRLRTLFANPMMLMNNTHLPERVAADTFPDKYQRVAVEMLAVS